MCPDEDDQEVELRDLTKEWTKMLDPHVDDLESLRKSSSQRQAALKLRKCKSEATEEAAGTRISSSLKIEREEIVVDKSF